MKIIQTTEYSKIIKSAAYPKRYPKYDDNGNRLNSSGYPGIPDEIGNAGMEAREKYRQIDLQSIKERTMGKLRDDPNFTAEDIPYPMQSDSDVINLMEQLYGIHSSSGDIIFPTPKLISFRKKLQENRRNRESQDSISEREGLSNKPSNVNTLGLGRGNYKDKERVEKGKAKGEQFGFGQTNENYGPTGRGR